MDLHRIVDLGLSIEAAEDGERKVRGWKKHETVERSMCVCAESLE